MNWLLLLLLFIASPAWGYKFASGSYTGNSADNRNIVIASTTSPSVTSFQPDVVFVKCRGGQPMMWSTRDMIATLGEAAIRLDASSGIFTDVIQAFNSDGFQVGTSDLANADTQTCYYTALANNGGDLAVGHVTGDSSDNRAIDISSTSLGAIADFSPEFVLVQTDDNSNSEAMFRTTAMSGDKSCFFQAFACMSNGIQAFNGSGFEVGTDATVNRSGQNVFYLAIKAVSGSTSASSYVGNAVGDGVTNDNRAVTLPGFLPQFVIIKGESGSRVAIWRFKDNSGDEAFSSDADVNTDRIQQFLSTGFEVGTALSVNENTVTMYYYALKSVPAAPATVRRHRPVVIQ